MHNFKLKIPQSEAKDLKIIYKENNDILHEIKASKDEIIQTLHYFEKRSNEINQSKLIYIEENISFDIFKSFISCIHTKEIDINEENYQTYYYLSQKYGYNELSEQIKEFVATRPDIFLVLGDLSNQTDLVKNSIDPQKEELISKNIDFSIKSGLLSKLPIEIIVRILNSPHRVVKDHHSLFSFVIGLMRAERPREEDDEFIKILPSCLDFCEMTNDEIETLFSITKSDTFLNPCHSKEKIKELISSEKDLRKKFDDLSQTVLEIQKNLTKNSEIFERIEKVENQLVTVVSKMSSIDEKIQEQKSRMDKNEQLINSIENKLDVETSKRHLLKPSIDSNQNQINEIKKELSEIYINQNRKECSNGIFKYLFDKYKANPVDKGIIEINANSGSDSFQKNLPHLIEPDWNGVWGSKYIENSYIQFNFKNSLVKINKYFIHVGNSINTAYFNNWILEGTTKDNREIKLDEVNNMPQITPDNQKITKEIQNNEYVKSIKLTMKGMNSCNNYCMVVRNIEFFGYYSESS